MASRDLPQTKIKLVATTSTKHAWTVKAINSPLAEQIVIDCDCKIPFTSAKLLTTPVEMNSLFKLAVCFALLYIGATMAVDDSDYETEVNYNNYRNNNNCQF